MSGQVNPDGVLAGKVAVVTGASRGIGEAIAIRYAMEGARVVVSARTVNDGDHVLPGSISSVVDRIRSAGGEATAVATNLAIDEDRVDLIRQTEALYGPVDILVNNAAVTFYIPSEDFQQKRYDLMMDVQVYAPFHLTQLVLPGMKARGEGWILNISSHAALHPPSERGDRGGTVYGMCKAALERMTTGLAAELYRHNIGVNAISPGLIATPGAVYNKVINDANKDYVTPVEHMAEACLALVHGDPKTITGKVTYADVMLKEFNLTPMDLIA